MDQKLAVVGSGLRVTTTHPVAEPENFRGRGGGGGEAPNMIGMSCGFYMYIIIFFNHVVSIISYETEKS